MTATGPHKGGGRVQQGIRRGEGAMAPPRSSTSGLSFAAAVASAGEPRPSPPGAATAGGARGGGVGKGRAPVSGGVLRVSPSSSPLPPRPEPKRKKGGLPPSNAATSKAGPPSGASKKCGMWTPVSSIPVKDPWVGGRDVTVDKFLSAVSLLAECGSGVVVLGYPTRGVAASPPMNPSPDVPGSTDGGLAGCDTRCKRDGRRGFARRSHRPPLASVKGFVMRSAC